MKQRKVGINLDRKIKMLEIFELAMISFDFSNDA
jgi:hypothetical protein